MKRHLIVLSSVLLLFLSGAAVAKDFDREFTFASNELKLANLVGSVRIVEAEGKDFQVSVTVRGDDATEDFLEFDTAVDNSLVIKFPLDKHDEYIYPALGGRSKTTIRFHDDSQAGNSWLKKIFSGMNGSKVTIRGKGHGKEVWADVTVQVPAGGEFELRQGVGTILATDLRADLKLDLNSGGIEVRQLAGDLLADTGSGAVVATGVTGEVDIDTGSGNVEVGDCEGEAIKVDTGSGRVVATDLKCDYLLVDTGSGSIKARRIVADRARLDTGSGSVLLQLDRMGQGKFVVDTGSGSIELALPRDASARVIADTGSGRVSNDFPGAEVIHKERNEMELVVGDGEARVILDAGSGSIKVRQQ